MHHRPTAARALAATAATVLATLLVTTSPAPAEVLCTVSELTDATSGSPNEVSVDASGDTVAFTSNANLVGTNADGSNEVYVYDVPSGSVEQITDGSASAPTFNVSISDDGNRIAMSSRTDPLGSNVDGNDEIFRYDRDTETFTQLTTTTGSDANLSPTISGDGSRIAFTSDQNLVGTNSDGNREVFWSTAAGTITQVTNSSSGGSFTDLGFDDAGTRLAFSATSDLVGDNEDQSTEVFDHTVGGSTVQITDTEGTAFFPTPSVSGDAAVLTFDFDADLTGGNADATQEVFQTTDGTSFDQITASSDSTFEPTSDQTGDRVAFRSAADLAGDNGDGNGEIFLHEGATETFVQVTDSAGGGSTASSAPAISDDGTRIAFVSNRSLDGQNDNGNTEVFLASCSSPEQTFTDVPTSHPFFDEIGWMDAAGISTGFQPGPTYKPDASVTRAAMSAFMYRLAGLPAFEDPVSPTFGDVPTSHPFFTEVEWMAAEGITTGFPGGLYKPADAVTRQSMSAFMFRLAGSPAFTPPGSPSFGDVPTSHPFFDEIEWMADEAITTGFPGGLYKPSENVTRQAMSAFMFRLADGPGVDLG